MRQGVESIFRQKESHEQRDEGLQLHGDCRKLRAFSYYSDEYGTGNGADELGKVVMKSFVSHSKEPGL